MACNWKDRLTEIEQRKAELLGEVNNPETTAERMAEIETESRNLAKEEKEARSRWNLSESLAVKVDLPEERGKTNTSFEQRANDFKATNKMSMKLFAEKRSLLVSSGKIATPTAVSPEIGELPSVVCSIVDDVYIVDATGTGNWDYPYEKTEASAEDVTEGQAIGGTGPTYDKVTIGQKEWGVLSEVSNQIKKMTSVNYTQSVQEAAYLALRRKARDKIVEAVKASTLKEEKSNIALNESYIRTIVLGYDSDESVGEGKLYINKEDLITLGAVRGSDKKPVYEISFEDQNNGIIKDGGTMVKFSVCKSLTTGEQLYGNPKTIKMLMWGDYEISTDDGGDYFKRNMMGVRGLATAGVDLTVYHGMQLIKQAGG